MVAARNERGPVPPKIIYLDTNLWNRLLDPNVEPALLLSELQQCGYPLALSGQNVYELTRTFRTSKDRGKDLFRYIKVYVDTGNRQGAI